MAWGRSMGMGEDFLLEDYPPKTLLEAVQSSRSERVQALYQRGEEAAQKVLESGTGFCAALNSYRLPEELLPFPGGQLMAFARMGNYAENVRRYQRFFRQKVVLAETSELTQPEAEP
ncbi:unnamed protein product [Effrenium voratum]|nr:unnamed protein product [Effrenium voratum]